MLVHIITEKGLEDLEMISEGKTTTLLKRDDIEELWDNALIYKDEVKAQLNYIVDEYNNEKGLISDEYKENCIKRIFELEYVSYNYFYIIDNFFKKIENKDYYDFIHLIKEFRELLEKSKYHYHDDYYNDKENSRFKSESEILNYEERIEAAIDYTRCYLD